MTDEGKAEEIKYLRFATEEDKTKKDLFKLALDRRYLINDLVKENAELKAKIQKQKEISYEYVDKVEELKEFVRSCMNEESKYTMADMEKLLEL